MAASPHQRKAPNKGGQARRRAARARDQEPRRTAAKAAASGQKLDEQVAFFLAKHIRSNVRELEGALTRLRGLRSRMVELGRSCVHAEYRNGGVIMALWGALGDRVGRKLMIVRANMAIVVFVGLMAFVTSPWQLLALRLGQGLFQLGNTLRPAINRRKPQPQAISKAAQIIGQNDHDVGLRRLGCGQAGKGRKEKGGESDDRVFHDALT